MKNGKQERRERRNDRRRGDWDAFDRPCIVSHLEFVVSLASNQIRSEGASHLAQALVKNTYLKQLV